jgi:hypothetical protein
MNNPNNLLNMMQTGGQASTAGGAALARALQRQSDIKKLERQQRSEARRQKRGSLFGSIGSLAGGLLAAALAPATAGASLALYSGVGAGLGKRIGEGIGAGKSREYDSSGTVYGQQAFKDINQASRDYTRGMGERALVSGAQTALTAGLSPGGGMYGKVGGKLRTLPSTGGVAPVAASVADTGSLFSDLGASPLPFGSASSVLQSDFIPAGYGASTTSNFSGGSPQIGYNQPLLNLFEDGGLAGYQTGGFTAQGFLQQQGLDPTAEQLKLFQSFDPAQIQQAKTGAEQSLLSMTGGMGLSSVGGGFGAKQRAATSAIGAGQDMIGDATEQAQRAFESQTLGTAADLVAGGASIKPFAKEVDSIPLTDEGLIRYGGQEYTWKDGSYQLLTDAGTETAYEEAAEVTGGDPSNMSLTELLAGMSDMSLKKNINFIGKSKSGTNIYTFEYKDNKYGQGVYEGVMAQEVPWASIKTNSGYLAVDYSKVDVDFKRIA